MTNRLTNGTLAPHAATKNALAAALGAACLTLIPGVQAQDSPQGMYAADDIMEADAYIVDGSGEAIGEVDDILFDEQMTIAAVVIESGKVLGLGGRDLVVDANHFTLETRTREDDGESEIRHRVMIDATSDEMANFPTYNHDWWEQAQSNAQDAWQKTQEGAESAWQTTREGAKNAWQKTRDAASGMSD